MAAALRWDLDTLIVAPCRAECKGNDGGTLYAEKERLLKLKHHLELEKLAARREKARLSTTGILGQMFVNLGPDPLDVEAAELKEKQNNELIALVEERMASAGHVPKGKTQSAPESIRANAETFAPESHLKVERQESIPEIRKALLAAYKSNAREKGIRITDVMVAKAGIQENGMIEQWSHGGSETTQDVNSRTIERLGRS